MLRKAIEAEVASYISEHADEVDEDGRRRDVRNNRGSPRTTQTGVGELEVEPPRVNDKRVAEDGSRHRFTTKILLPYLRRTRDIEDLVPWLYLKGISTNDFTECLQKLVGSESASVSPTTVVRLTEAWFREYETWNERSLGGKRSVYVWADGSPSTSGERRIASASSC